MAWPGCPWPGAHPDPTSCSQENKGLNTGHGVHQGSPEENPQGMHMWTHKYIAASAKSAEWASRLGAEGTLAL